jgi:hypothetical protein
VCRGRPSPNSAIRGVDKTDKLPASFDIKMTASVSILYQTFDHMYRASHIRFISEFILYATNNTNDADSLIPFIM